MGVENRFKKNVMNKKRPLHRGNCYLMKSPTALKPADLGGYGLFTGGKKTICNIFQAKYLKQLYRGKIPSVRRPKEFDKCTLEAE